MSSTALPRLLSQPVEPDLVGAARTGDRQAFEQLYRQHVGRVYAVCLRLVADVELAEQLTQDAFVQAWHKLPGFRGDSAFGTWLHRVAINVVLDWRRAHKRRLQLETELDDVAELRPSTSARVGDRMDLERALAALPPGARTVFVLHEVEGYRVREVADLLAIAEGTVKAQLFRARRLLREALQ